MNLSYDIIIVGGGHAGCEAAVAASNLNAKVLLITIDMFRFSQMSCNPAIGGIAKGQIVREIDALGGYTGIVTDQSMIQFRMLNKSKGPAMWSPRAQCDRVKYSINWRNILENTINLDLYQGLVNDLIIDNNNVIGVITNLGIKINCKAVILTCGTFQNGLIHIGRFKQEGGRISELSVKGLSDKLLTYGFEVGRMKTGTSARIDGRSINFNILEEQKGDNNGNFSFLKFNKRGIKYRSCYITYTNEKVHRILERGFKDSPLYNGSIKGIGPRYCPSIEDKIVTFHDKKYHQLFLEPEGNNTVEYYLNGFSSSLPINIQYEALTNIKGLENVKIFRPGYAIEYDYYPPTQLKHTLETKIINKLYFAGQINGTTGYEEAAAQGLIAGINAALIIKNENEFVLKRNQAYIGVLIDDLVTKGVDEPYRMFTSRAEHRILLRQDNADDRLTSLGYSLGIVNKKRYKRYTSKYFKINKLINFISITKIEPNNINPFLIKISTSKINQKTKLLNIISRPQVTILELMEVCDILKNFINKNFISTDEIEQVEIIIKYSGYINRENLIVDKLKRLENIKIHNNFDYSKLKSLSTEARQKLKKIMPTNIGQASRISGVSPSDINVLLIHLGR